MEKKIGENLEKEFKDFLEKDWEGLALHIVSLILLGFISLVLWLRYSLFQ